MTQISVEPIQTNQREKKKNRKREIDKNELRHRLLLLVIRIEQKRIPKKGLRWNPPGKRKQGRLKMTLGKIFEGDFKKIALTWGTAEREAKERHSWRKRCSYIILNG